VVRDRIESAILCIHPVSRPAQQRFAQNSSGWNVLDAAAHPAVIVLEMATAVSFAIVPSHSPESETSARHGHTELAAYRMGVTPHAISFHHDLPGLPFGFDEREKGATAVASIPCFTAEDRPSAPDELTHQRIRFRLQPARIVEIPDHALWMSFFDDSEANRRALMSEVVHDP
jgi:hypothetical protein